MLHERVYVTQTCLQIAVGKKAIVQHSRLSLSSVSAAEKEEMTTDRVCCVLWVRSASHLFTYNTTNNIITLRIIEICSSLCNRTTALISCWDE